ncbi:MAG TPA: beta-galactosidase GalA [Acidobacteriaceae bacterium]|jgi:beta-galactosidase|nr:beta-galactosidase GalA [Acidobacteriaceae bacterium]
MKPFSRRALLKSGLIAPAAAAAMQQMGPLGMAMQTAPESASPINQAPNAPLTATERERLLLDFGWRFHLGNADDPSKDFGLGLGSSGDFQKTGNFLPASNIAFDDGDWTAIDLPHDWAVELPFTNDPALASKGFYPLGRTYPATSVGWYRRVFELPASDAGKRINLEFDGAYRETLVALNGFYIGQHSGGYDPFSFDVTDFVNPGAINVLLVRVDATLSDGWFYEGAGIYRHVWLVKTSPVHVKKWGTFVSSEVRSGEAALSIRTEVENQSGSARSVRVVSTVLDPSGRKVASATSDPNSISQGSEQTYEQKITVQRPQLWSLEERNLYQLVTELRADGAVVDRYQTPFGIRTITIDPQQGVFLNGSHVKIKGTCNHQDHAGIGAALPDAVQYYRIRKLQEMGCNSLRTSHNPPTPELLDACDVLGMLVFDETRMMSSNPDGLSQFGDLVRRDRNRPSVFMWSMGNEERVANTERGVLILSAMKALAEELDGTRPVSIAPTGAIGTGGLAVCDVIGYNYMDPQALAYHEAHPGKPVIGTETVSAVCTRGIYITDPTKGYVGSYDPYTTTGRASAEGWWRFCDAQPWLAGGFVWTGFDYRGEPSPYQWPNISSQYGIIDTCGFPKDTFYYYQSWWTGQPVLHLFPHWNWSGYEGKEIAVWVHTNLDRVELFVNGRSLGAQEVKKNQHLAWNVSYVPGTIEARGYKADKLVMTTRRETTGSAAKLVMTADRREVNADGEDVAMFAVAVHDAQGRVVPIADNEVTFQISGPGRLIGVGNGDPTDHASDKGTSRKAFSGLCMAIVQPAKQAGSITVHATSPGLVPATVTISAREVSLRPQIAVWQREAPVGSGITGLWRPIPPETGSGEMVSMLTGANSTLFTLQQNGNNLTGNLEGGGGGNELSVPIENGKIEGSSISFKAGNSTFTGTLTSDRISLERRIEFSFRRPQPATPTGPQPAIGPPPDGSDPSFNRSRRMPESIPIVLHRVER